MHVHLTLPSHNQIINQFKEYIYIKLTTLNKAVSESYFEYSSIKNNKYGEYTNYYYNKYSH